MIGDWHHGTPDFERGESQCHMSEAHDFKLALTRVIEPTGGPGAELATLEDAARFIGLMRPWRQTWPHWDYAAELVLIAAANGHRGRHSQQRWISTWNAEGSTQPLTLDQGVRWPLGRVGQARIAQARLAPRKADQRFRPSRERPRFGSCLNVRSRASLICGCMSFARCLRPRMLQRCGRLVGLVPTVIRQPW